MKKLLALIIVLTLFPSYTFAAISFVRATGNSGANNSFAFDATGCDYLIVAIEVDATAGNPDPVSAVTYNGVSMTQLVKKTGTVGVNQNIPNYIYGLASPTTGSNTVSVTNSAQTYSYDVAACYLGASAIQPDSSNGNITNSASSPYSLSTTVVAANSWMIWYVRDSAGTTITASTNATQRSSDFTGIKLFDTNGPQSAGSHSMAVTFSGTDNFISTMISLAPASTPAPATVSSIVGLVKGGWIY